MLVIFPLERDLAVFVGEKTLIGYGDTVRITAEVFNRLLGAAEGRFRVNNPFAVFQRTQQCRKGEGILKRLDGAGKLKLSLVESVFQIFEKAPPEQAGED